MSISQETEHSEEASFSKSWGFDAQSIKKIDLNIVGGNMLRANIHLSPEKQNITSLDEQSHPLPCCAWYRSSETTPPGTP